MSRSDSWVLQFSGPQQGRVFSELKPWGSDQPMAAGECRWSELWSRVQGPLFELERGSGQRRRRGEDGGACGCPDLREQLSQVGSEMWGRLLPAAVREALVQLIEMAREASPLLLGIDPGKESHLQRLPWAALRPDHGVALGVHRRVVLWQRVSCSRVPTTTPGAPPLRLVFAVSMPNPPPTGAIMADPEPASDTIDFDREERVILDALLSSQGGALYTAPRPRPFVAAADEGHLDAIAKAATDAQAQVLHLSGHGVHGRLLLENHDGGPAEVTGAELAAVLGERCPALRLVVLSECLSGAPLVSGGVDEERGGLAAAAAEVAAVVGQAVGMLWSVSDAAAREWAGHFYHQLVPSGFVAAAAVAAARRRLLADQEARRTQGVAFGAGTDWASPMLFASEPPQLIVDRDRPAELVERPPAPDLARIEAARQVGAFVGRRQERRDALRCLLNSPARVLVIRGIGGVGKSALAARLAGSLDRRVVVPEAPLTIPGLIAKLARGIGADLTPKHRKALQTSLTELETFAAAAGDVTIERVKTVLQQKLLPEVPLCAILDDFEQNLALPETLQRREVPAAVHPLPGQTYKLRDPDLARLLVWLAGQEVRLIVTTRYDFALPGLAARQRHDLHLGELSRSDAIKLTLRQEGINRQGYTVEKRADMVEAFGRHPRALEFFDALLRNKAKVSLADISSQVQDHLGQLVAAGQSAAGREQDDELTALSMVAQDLLLDHLIAELARRAGNGAVTLLRRLALLRRPFGQMAVNLLAQGKDFGQDGPASRADLDLWLGKMSELELLTDNRGWHEGPEPGPRHIVPRLLARLLVDGETAEFASVHELAARYYAFLGQQAGLDPAGHLERRHHLLAAGQMGEAAHATLHLCQLFFHLCLNAASDGLAQEVIEADRQRLLPPPLRARLRLAGLRSRRVLEGPAKTMAALEDVVRELVGLKPETDVLTALSELSTEASEFDRDTREALAECSYELAGSLMNMGQAGRARTMNAVVIQLSEFPAMRAKTRHQSAEIERSQGNFDSARKLLQKSLSAFQELGDRRNHAASRHRLAQVEFSQGNLMRARQHLEKSLPVFKELGDLRGISASLHQLGMIESSEGHFERARQLLEKSLTAREESGDLRGRATSLHELAHIEYSQGNLARARQLLENSQAIAEELADSKGRATCLHELAIVDCFEGKFERARQRLLKALTITGEHDRAGRATSLHQLAVVEYSQGNHKRARQLLQESLGVGEPGDLMRRASFLAQMGVWEIEAGEIGSATALLAEAAQIFERLGTPVGLAQVKVALAPLIVQSEPVEGVRMAALAAAELDRLGHPEADDATHDAQALAEAVLAMIGEAEAERDYAKAVGRGTVLLTLGRHEEALPLLQRAEHSFSIGKDREGAARATWILGNCELGLAGHEEQGHEHIRRARQLAREIGMGLPELATQAPLSPTRLAADALARAVIEATEVLAQGVDDSAPLRDAVARTLEGSDDDLVDTAQAVIRRVASRDQGLLAGLPVFERLLEVAASVDGGERLVLALRTELTRLADFLRSNLEGRLRPEREAFGRFQLGYLLRLLRNHEAAIAEMERSLELNTRLGNSDAVEALTKAIEALHEAAA